MKSDESQEDVVRELYANACKNLDAVTADRDEWKQQHENLLAIYQASLLKLGPFQWRRASDGKPTEHGRIYALWSPAWGGVLCEWDGTNTWGPDLMWLGPLPEAPKP